MAVFSWTLKGFVYLYHPDVLEWMVQEVNEISPSYVWESFNIPWNMLRVSALPLKAKLCPLGRQEDRFADWCCLERERCNWPHHHWGWTSGHWFCFTVCIFYMLPFGGVAFIFVQLLVSWSHRNQKVTWSTTARDIHTFQASNKQCLYSFGECVLNKI